MLPWCSACHNRVVDVQLPCLIPIACRLAGRKSGSAPERVTSGRLLRATEDARASHLILPNTVQSSFSRLHMEYQEYNEARILNKHRTDVKQCWHYCVIHECVQEQLEHHKSQSSTSSDVTNVQTVFYWSIFRIMLVNGELESSHQKTSKFSEIRWYYNFLIANLIVFLWIIVPEYAAHQERARLGLTSHSYSTINEIYYLWEQWGQT